MLSGPLNHETWFDKLPLAVRLRAYLWVCWCCARASEKAAKTADTIVASLCAARLWNGDVIEADDGGVIFLPATVVFRFRPTSKGLARKLGVQSLREAYAGKTIYDSLTLFAGSPLLKEWRHERKLDLGSRLRGNSRSVFETITGSPIAEPLPYRGIPLIGYDPEKDSGFALMGIRDVSGIETLSPQQRHYWLSQPAELLERCNDLRQSPWWSTKENDRLIAAPSDILNKAIQEMFHDEYPGLCIQRIDENQSLIQDPKDHLFVSVEPWLAAATSVIRRLGHADRQMPKLNLVVAGREHVAQRLSRAPWLWSKYFGDDIGFRIVKWDAGSLRCALSQDGAILRSDGELVERKEIADTLRGRKTRVCLHGETGTGKTTALYQLLAHIGDVVVVVRGTANSKELDRLDDILESITEPLSIGIDDLDQASSAVREWAIRRATRSGSVYVTNKAELNGFTNVSLASVSTRFLTDICVRMWGPRSFESLIPVFTFWEALATTASPHLRRCSLSTAVEGFECERARAIAIERGFADLAAHETDVHQGRERLRALRLGGDYALARREQGSAAWAAMQSPSVPSKVTRALWLLAGLRWAGWLYVPVSLARAYYGRCYERYTLDAEELDEALPILREHGFIEVHADCVALIDDGLATIAESEFGDAQKYPAAAGDLLTAILCSFPEGEAYFHRQVVTVLAHRVASDLGVTAFMHALRDGATKEVERTLCLFGLLHARRGDAARFFADVTLLCRSRRDVASVLTDALCLFERGSVAAGATAEIRRFAMIPGLELPHALMEEIFAVLAPLGGPMGTDEVLALFFAQVRQEECITPTTIRDVAAQLSRRGFTSTAQAIVELIASMERRESEHTN